MAVISFKCPNCDGELIFDPKHRSINASTVVQNLPRRNWMHCSRQSLRKRMPVQRMVLMKQSRKQPNSRVRTQRKKKGRTAAQRQSFITALPVEQKS